MPKLSILGGTTSKLVDVFIQDTSVTTGAGLTGLTNASSGLTWYYYREGANASVQVTSIASATLGTWTTKGFIVIDGTNMPGCYQLGVPDAAIAAGAKSVIMLLKGATNMAPLVLEIELTATDNQDSVRGGMTALPSAVPGAAGGVFIAGTNAATTVTTSFTTTFTGSLTGSVASVTGAVGSVTGLTASNLDATISSRMASYTQPTGFLAATFPSGTIANTTNITSITGNITGNLSGSVGSVTGAVGSVTGAVGSVTGSVGSVVGLTASNLDATVSSRLASASYTAPDNAGVAVIGVQTTAIKVKTDSLTFSVAGQVSANVTYVNGVLVTGTGTAINPWGP